MKTWKQCLPDVLAVLLFAVLSFAYFFPADTEGRILYQHDASAGRGAGIELQQYKDTHDGAVSRWTNSLFGGMPTYQMAPSYGSSQSLSFIAKVYHLFLPDYVWYVFAFLLGFYILLRAFDFRQSLAALGSVIWAFSSYFFIIIAAGHIWKVMTLAYIPPTIAGLVFAYKGKYLWGGIVTALFVALQVNANHVQMSYYFLPVMLFMVIAYLVKAIKEKQLAGFGKATATVIVGALLGVCINISNLYHTYMYQNESMRGKSELVKKNSANQMNSGLDRDYITMWSYGIGETWTLLVPNVKGGTSAVPLSENETAMAKANTQYSQLYQQIGQYWGEQPGTSGPVYVGAFVLMLFFLGLFIVKGPMKWALLAATVLSIFLSWGKNFMGLTDFFIDYVPMYAKFRTVASILVIAEFTIPLLAMMALKEVVYGGRTVAQLRRPILLSFALTGGVSLLFALMPGLFFGSFVSSGELQAMQQIPADQLRPLMSNLTEMRKAMLTSDAWRSFAIILTGSLCLLFFKAKKLRAGYLMAILTVLCLLD